jgi:uncharacterized membrane protein YfcA
MEPIFGLMLFIVVTTIVCVIAKKRGQTWPLYLVVSVVGAPVAAMLVAQIDRNGFGPAIAAFLVPIACLFYSLATANGKDEVVADSKGFKKCPFCAEAVRVEAIKCKHCGSALKS